jgi:hydroxyacylglutathione hydrolase
MLHVKHFTFNFIQENTYIVYDDISLEAVIIDAGNQYPQEDETLFKFVDDHQLKVTRLLNTHAHIDHIMGNKSCSLKYGLTPEIHPEDISTFEMMIQSGEQWGIDLSTSPVPKTTLKENDEILLGKEKMKILFTPGHCKGHVSFYCAQQNFLLSGDVIFMRSIGRTDLPGGDTQTLLNSIQQKIYTLPPQTIIYSGHGDSTSVGYEMMHNPYVRG